MNDSQKNECIFCNIREGKMTAKFFYQDEEVMAFPDIHPNAPTHILVVPKQHIPEFIFLEDAVLQEKLFRIVRKVIDESPIRGKRYQIRMNGGGLQDVNHLHIHVMGPMKDSY